MYLRNSDKYINLDILAFYIALAGIFLELPLKSILIYVESLTDHHEFTRAFIRNFIKIPILLLLLSLFVREVIRKTHSKETLILLSAYCMFSGIILLIIIFNIRNKTFYEFSINNLKITLHYSYFLLLGYYLMKDPELLRKVRWLFLAGIGAVVCMIVIFFDRNTLTINLSQLKVNNYIHLILGNSLALFVLLSFNSFKNNKYILFLYLICIPFIFFLSSRAAFYSFALSLPLVLIISGAFKKGRLLILLLIVLSIVGMVLILPDHRMTEVIQITGKSLSERIVILKSGVEDISRNLFTGNYGGYFEAEQPTNTYIHNFLSFWRQYGLITFLLFSWMMIYSGYIITKQTISSKSHKYLSELSIFIYMVIIVITSKSYVYSHYFIILGVAMAVTNRSKANTSLT